MNHEHVHSERSTERDLPLLTDEFIFPNVTRTFAVDDFDGNFVSERCTVHVLPGKIGVQVDSRLTCEGQTKLSSTCHQRDNNETTSRNDHSVMKLQY